MIDKEKILNILTVRKEVLNNNNDIFKEIIIPEIDFLIKRIEDGFFDIPQKPQETCRWEIYNIHPSSGEGIYYGVECNPNLYQLYKGDQYKYCPYCSKPIEVKEDE